MKPFLNLNLIIASLLLTFCSTKQDRKFTQNDTITIIGDKTSGSQITEIFVDSLNIGKKGQCKIELTKYKKHNNVYAVIGFYTKKLNFWYIRNSYTYEGTIVTDFDPNISDFNNDGLNDITIISGEATRGANQVRRLFIYDEQQHKLISIINSQGYPNISFNKKLNCIDAFTIYGSSSATDFAKIVGDSLKTFASIENGVDFRTIYENDENGIKKEIYRIPNKEKDINEVIIRHNNYKPLEK